MQCLHDSLLQCNASVTACCNDGAPSYRGEQGSCQLSRVSSLHSLLRTIPSSSSFHLFVSYVCLFMCVQVHVSVPVCVCGRQRSFHSFWRRCFSLAWNVSRSLRPDGIHLTLASQHLDYATLCSGWVFLGMELGSSCFHSKHITNRAIPSPHPPVSRGVTGLHTATPLLCEC